MIYIHLGALLFLVLLIAWGEKDAIAWVRGKKETLSAKKLHMLHATVWVLLGVMILSGVLLALPLQEYLIQTPAFYVKMAFVLALLVNSFFIGKYMNVASEKSFASLTKEERIPLLISGGVSLVSWVGAFVAALFMTSSDFLTHFLSHLIHGHIH